MQLNGLNKIQVDILGQVSVVEQALGVRPSVQCLCVIVMVSLVLIVFVHCKVSVITCNNLLSVSEKSTNC